MYRVGFPHESESRLAQSVEHETLNLGVVGSSPTLGEKFHFISLSYNFCNMTEGFKIEETR